ncbi:hypothetical protein HQ393_06520 [Chitinibacter bivalviorum]|uniref:DUF6602 domain-containing protein n=1 Tax=Chitinibacter bivalviorum TaxID=2739434 RepID=A0A7H9BKD1_9NEIS|nr:DUF6602 domain-containing protein [Chitinibacter bivalviorum]QLG87944.1 hypothetical protein HQ393_06520 [Chitinibacter bivalviorum]
MISLASELLARFIDEEKRKLVGISMPHMPTLGEAYESITKDGIDQGFVIPKGLDLRVVSGFIEIKQEMLPEQIDCMLVCGVGRQYGRTEKYIYPIESVLCIFEVKKTLTKSDYLDAMLHLAKIRKAFSESFEDRLINEGFEPDISRAAKYFSQITGVAAPKTYSDIHNLSREHGVLFYSLVQEQYAPISIIHGYGGYKREEGIRSAFMDILDSIKNDASLNVGYPGIPTLVTSNQFCIVKGNGSPFIATRSDGSWVALLSSRHNPLQMMLELIWSKISQHFDVSMPWGDDLDFENLSPLMLAKPIEFHGKIGWFFESLEYKEASLNRDAVKKWDPEKLDAAGMTLVNHMFFYGGQLLLDESMKDYIQKEHGLSLDSVVNNLILTMVFAKDGDYLFPVNNSTMILPNDDGTGYLATDKNRFDAWCRMHKIEPNYIHLLMVD